MSRHSTAIDVDTCIYITAMFIVVLLANHTLLDHILDFELDLDFDSLTRRGFYYLMGKIEI